MRSKSYTNLFSDSELHRVSKSLKSALDLITDRKETRPNQSREIILGLTCIVRRSEKKITIEQLASEYSVSVTYLIYAIKNARNHLIEIFGLGLERKL